MRHTPAKFHPPPLWRTLLEWIRGREEMFIQPSEDFPRLLLVYPKGARPLAVLLATLYTRTLPLLPPGLLSRYSDVLRQLPSLVVVQLRARNTCDCLGHVHPSGTESRLARRLAEDLNYRVAEVDMAYEAIREWHPRPLAELAVSGGVPDFAQIQFRAALLCVLLHELDHVANPEKTEGDVRRSSDQFYAEVLEALLREEKGVSYGL